jgi:hypothetical protein
MDFWHGFGFLALKRGGFGTKKSICNKSMDEFWHQNQCQNPVL